MRSILALAGSLGFSMRLRPAENHGQKSGREGSLRYPPLIRTDREATLLPHLYTLFNYLLSVSPYARFSPHIAVRRRRSPGGFIASGVFGSITDDHPNPISDECSLLPAKRAASEVSSLTGLRTGRLNRRLLFSFNLHRRLLDASGTPFRGRWILFIIGGQWCITVAFLCT